MDIKVFIGVIGESNNCSGLQPEANKLSIKTRSVIIVSFPSIQLSTYIIDCKSEFTWLEMVACEARQLTQT